MSSVHIINHTHWDREWFLTHEYTTAWIPALVDSLGKLVEENDAYQFLFDGQTLVVEDLLSTRPDYRDAVQDLIKTTALSIGPIYSQPDWRMVSGELHVRNLLYGLGDAEALGGHPDVAWLVDTFGHISQAPQLLAQTGIDAAFVWRGVPEMTPLFVWEGSDGTQIPTIDLFSGYRNLYGVTKTPDIAVDRLVAEVDKLAPVYGDLPIPLFDGYDLDTEPEDPARYYAHLDVPERISLTPSSPRAYVDAVLPFLDQASTVRGELLSGKYGSTFPGSLSSRTYLKLLHHDAEIALHRRVEPLAALATVFGQPSDDFAPEQVSRELLQNGVHDCICGVSIDQVHERMDRSYRRILDWAAAREAESAKAILGGFASGTYAVSTAASPADYTVRADGAVHRVQSKGVGVTAVNDVEAAGAFVEQSGPFSWVNEHYEAVVDASAGLTVNDRPGQARIVVRRDAGDTYSSEPGETLGLLAPSGPMRVSGSGLDTVVALPMSFEVDDIHITAELRFTFDHTAVIRVDIDLDSTGTGYRADIVFDSGIATDTVRAAMPFDVVERPHVETDLLGTDIPYSMQSILMGQRETGIVDEFPFHDYVAITAPGNTWAVLGSGNRSYASTADGELSVALRRSAEWLALTGLERRIGDAGPAMYVPGARCERSVQHQLGLVVLPHSDPWRPLMSLSESFHNPAILAAVDGDGTETQWNVFAEDLPLTSMTAADGGAIVRLFNPSEEPVRLESVRPRLSLRGADLGQSADVRPKEIVTVAIDLGSAPATGTGQVSILNPTRNRVGPSRSKPDAETLRSLEARIDQLQNDLDRNAAALIGSDGDEIYRLTHRAYVLEREQLELKLSLELNRRLAQSAGDVSLPDQVDPAVAELGWALNELRVKRRIYDYVVQSLPPETVG